MPTKHAAAPPARSIGQRLNLGVLFVTFANMVPIGFVGYLSSHLALVWYCAAAAGVCGVLSVVTAYGRYALNKHFILGVIFLASCLPIFALGITPAPYYLTFPSLMACVTMYHGRLAKRLTLIAHGLVVWAAFYFEPATGTEVRYLTFATLANMTLLFAVVTYFSERSLRSHFRRTRDLEAQLATRELSLKQHASRVQAQAERLAEANASLETEISENESTLAELQSANEEAAQLAQAASSDLKEPLRGIGTFIGLMRRRLEQLGLAEQVGDYLHYITDGATRMDAMVNDLLRYGDYKATPEREDIDTAEVLDTIGQNLVDLLHRENATLEVLPGLPTVAGQRTQVVQLFQNLISNGIKFKRPGVAPVCTVGCELSDGHVTFFVRDNGIGMPQERLKDVFGLFTRLHKADGYEGTGIGLALCRRIVMAAGGEIWAESTEGEGTTFRFTWPLRSASLGPVEPGATAAAQ